MPFTGSHPAAVVPLFGRGLAASALVVGSIAPDLPYFLPSPFTTRQTHSVTGVISVDLVIGVVAFLVWHLVLVRPLLWISPEPLQRRIPDGLRTGFITRYGSLRTWASVCLAIVIGAGTHYLWDAFTHPDMWGPRVIPGLTTVVFGLSLTRWLHLVSSVAGLAILAWFLRRWWRAAPEVGSVHPVRPALRWTLLAVLGGTAVLVGLWRLASLVLAPGPFSAQVAFVDALIRGTTTLIVGVLGLALVWHAAQAAQTYQARAGTSRL